MSLQPIREEIDSIDRQLIELFVRRMKCSGKVAEYKLQKGMPIFDAEREQIILDSVEEKAGKFGGSARLLYSTLMELSRGLQHDIIGSGDVLRNHIRSAASSLPTIDGKLRVACFGAEGAYAHKAARKIFPGAEPVFYSPFKEVFRAVMDGEADLGVIPIENSSAGSVTAVYDLMLRYRFYIAAAEDIRIEHCLAALNGTRLSDIRTVYSHEQALSQCSDYINAHPDIRTRSYVSTAQAAMMVSETADHTTAAICSEDAANRYGLEILLRGFQNDPNNTTRFIVISKELFIPPQADKISLCFALPHKTGSLYSILCRFASHGLNLTKIESRPIAGKPFEYMFYLDFTGSVSDPDTLGLLCALSDELTEFSFLGNYTENHS